MDQHPFLVALASSTLFPTIAKALQMQLPCSPTNLPDPTFELIKKTLNKYHLNWCYQEIQALQNDVCLSLQKFISKTPTPNVDDIEKYVFNMVDDYLRNCAKVNPSPYYNQIKTNT